MYTRFAPVSEPATLLHEQGPSTLGPIYIYTYIHAYIHKYVYIYIYIERERDMYITQKEEQITGSRL